MWLTVPRLAAICAPSAKGRCATMTHDYKRHGTTTLFAALNVKPWHARRPNPQITRPGVASRGAKVRFAPDSPLEGTGFEPSVPRQEKWSMPSSSDQTRVRLKVL
jgi:hypothetical protein